MANFNSLKSIITDDTIRINEKNQPRRTAENVANFIFCTNNSYPVKVSTGDRKYVVFHVNGKRKGDFEFWERLVASFDQKFYENLTTFYLTYDLSNFNVRDIPMTEAKRDLIEASRSPIDVWICDHYNELVSGLPCSDALVSKPVEMKDRSFQLMLKDKCDRLRKGGRNEGVWKYFLKTECRSLYKQSVSVEEEEAGDEEA